MMTYTAVYTWPSLETDFTLTTHMKNDATTVETTFDGARALDRAFLTWVHREKAFHGYTGSPLLFSPFPIGLY